MLVGEKSHSQNMDSQEGMKGNLSDVEKLLASLPNATWDSQMSLDNADRMLLQRLVRLTHALQQQDSGSATKSSTSSPMPGSATLHSQSCNLASTSPTTEYHSVAVGGFDAQGNGGELYDASDSWDYTHDGRSSKTGTPSSDGGDNISSQARPHAAVEKRYRRTVNTKLQQLHASIPASEKFVLSSDRDDQVPAPNDTEQAAKPVVLDKAIQYITHLLSTYRTYENDIQQLRRQVRDLVEEDDIEACPLHSPANHCDAQAFTN